MKEEDSTLPGSSQSKKRSKNFLHSLKLGDIIYSLPSVRALGGGRYYLGTYCTLNRSAGDSLIPLLSSQPYIEKCSLWGGEYIDVSFNRAIGIAYRQHKTIADAQLEELGLDRAERDTPWITIDDSPISIPGKSVAFTVVPRYFVTRRINWASLIKPYGSSLVYIGLESEWKLFCEEFSVKVDFYPTANMYEVARVFKGMDLFLGHPTGNEALAESMKMSKRIVCNQYDPWACMYPRKGASYIEDFR